MRRLLSGLLLSLGTIALAISAAAPQTDEDIEDTRTSTAQAVKNGDLNAKVFDSWESQMVLGDCKARKAKLTLYENGSVEWEAEILSIDVDDYWHQSFEFYEGSPDSQAPIGYVAERVFEIRLKYRWRSWRWGGPSSPDPQLAEVFDRIKTVRWIARC